MASRAGVIDFNSDLGESFGSYVMGLDEEIIKQVTSVNVATGFHAGDRDWMARTVKLAEENGVHRRRTPGLPGPGRIWPARHVPFSGRNPELRDIPDRRAGSLHLGPPTPTRKAARSDVQQGRSRCLRGDAIVEAVKAFAP